MFYLGHEEVGRISQQEARPNVHSGGFERQRFDQLVSEPTQSPQSSYCYQLWLENQYLQL